MVVGSRQSVGEIEGRITKIVVHACLLVHVRLCVRVCVLCVCVLKLFKKKCCLFYRQSTALVSKLGSWCSSSLFQGTFGSLFRLSGKMAGVGSTPKANASYLCGSTVHM